MVRDLATLPTPEILEGQNRILRRLALGEGLETLLPSLIQVFEEPLFEGVGQILLLDESGATLQHGAAPKLPQAFRQTLEYAPLTQAGTCGAAVVERRRVISHDIQRDAHWEPLRDLAQAHDFQACWAQPIESTDGEILGTFSWYWKTVRFPDDDELRILDTAAELAGLVLQRNQADKVLRFHQAAVGNANEAIFWIDREAHFFFFNEAARQSLGYSEEEMAKLQVFDVNPRIPAKDWPQRWKEMVRAGKLTFETVHLCKDGTTFPVEASASHLIFDGREYACVTVRDISARKVAQEEREHSDRRYQTLTEVSPVGIFRTDPFGNCLFVNQKWSSIAGLSSEQAAGDGWVQALHPEDSERIFEEWQAASQAALPFHSEYRFQHPDGTVRWVIGQAVSEQSDEGEIIGFVGTVTDITHQKMAARRLSSLVEGTSPTTGEAFFRSLVQHLSMAFEVRYALIGEVNGDRVQTLAVWDQEGKTGDFEFELTGSPCEHILETQKSCFFPQGVQSHFPDDRLLAEMGSESYMGCPLSDSEGRTLGHLAVVDDRPMAEDPENERLLAVFAARATAELTRLRLEEERRHLEAQVQHTQKLESLGILAGGIAHDFNNLLGGILGNAELAMTRLDPTAPSRPLVEDIALAAERCAELSNQMLAYSGKGSFIFEPIDLGDLVQEMVDLLRLSISKKARLELDFIPELPPIEGDPTQVRQVVMNLITNASDALGEENGLIQLRTRRLEVGPGGLVLPSASAVQERLEAGVYVVFEVEDDGCGMDETTRTRLFDPFFTTKFTGRGLGMAAVLGIVRGHRGVIEVESTPDQGSTFRVYFAAGVQNLRSPPLRPAPMATPWRGSGTILVVDDEEIVRVLARSILEDAGFQVVECTDGREALKAFQAHCDDIVLVLLDMTMPELDGAETFRALRESRADLRIILSSGYSEQVALQDLGQEGCSGFIQKPYRPIQLLERVQEILGNPEESQSAS